MIQTVHYGDPKQASIFEQTIEKFNDKVVLTEDDIRGNTRILCKEPYAQSLYDAYNSYYSKSDKVLISKDLVVDQEYSVKASMIDMQSKTIKCDEINSGTPIYVSFNDYIGELNDLHENPYFKVILLKISNGVYYGSNKVYSEIAYFEQIHEMHEKDQWFNVKIIELIRGGYRALYKNCIKCFIPGSHAAANIVTDFNSLIGQTIPVMVDSYDHLSKLFIVSYKKYITYSLPTMIHNLEFGKLYKGTLTSRPTKYGLFVEFENYFTGLVHATEFPDYDNVSATMKKGDTLDIYVKDVQNRDGQYRIILTLKEENINDEKLYWKKLKETCLGKELEYSYDEEVRKFYIQTSDMGQIGLSLNYNDIKDSLDKYEHVIIKEVDVIHQNIKFDFC